MKMCLAAVALCCLMSVEVLAQGVVTYGVKYHGKEVNADHPLIMTYQKGVAVLNPQQTKTAQFINYRKKATYQSLDYQGKTYTTKTPFKQLVKVEFLPETDTILGYVCHRAHLTLFSNSIDVWFTADADIKGSPSLSVAPYLGLVLKIVRNGNREIFAKSIKEGAIPDSLDVLPKPGELVDEATLRAYQIKSRYTTVPIFDNQTINFGDSIVNPKPGQFDKVYRYSAGTVILKRVHLPEDFDGQIFATLTQHSEGDAYDRTGSVFVIPMGAETTFLDALEDGVEVLPTMTDNKGDVYKGMTATENYVPPVELIRFYTPFGVRAYNHKREIKGYDWKDEVSYKQEVTHLAPLLEGEAWIGVYIGNYDKNGHKVSLELDYYPSEGEEAAQPFVSSIFNTLNIKEMSGQTYARFFDNDSLTVKAYVPEGVENLKLRYISTGHGGWGGGDEFNPKMNTLLIDGKVVYTFTPWRTDCGAHRLANPSSGNFSNGLSSSDLSRSGWCPGTATNPVFINLPQLTPGWHTFTIAIPEGPQEGNSFSFWNVSGVLIGGYSISQK